MHFHYHLNDYLLRPITFIHRVKTKLGRFSFIQKSIHIIIFCALLMVPFSSCALKCNAVKTTKIEDAAFILPERALSDGIFDQKLTIALKADLNVPKDSALFLSLHYHVEYFSKLPGGLSLHIQPIDARNIEVSLLGRLDKLSNHRSFKSIYPISLTLKPDAFVSHSHQETHLIHIKIDSSQSCVLMPKHTRMKSFLPDNPNPHETSDQQNIFNDQNQMTKTVLMQTLNIEGSIEQSVRTTTYHYDEKGQLVLEKYTYDDKADDVIDITTNTAYQYSATGHLIKTIAETIYSADGSVGQTTTTYHYNALGQLVAEKEVHTENNGNDAINALRLTTHQYNNNGQRVFTKSEPNSVGAATAGITDISRFEYNLYGQPLSIKHEFDNNSDGTINSVDIHTNVYNLKGQIAQTKFERDTRGNGSFKLVESNTYKYNNIGQLIRIQSDLNVISDGTIRYRKYTTYQYDEKGQRVQEKVEFDKQNNGTIDSMTLDSTEFDRLGYPKRLILKSFPDFGLGGERVIIEDQHRVKTCMPLPKAYKVP